MTGRTYDISGTADGFDTDSPSFRTIRDVRDQGVLLADLLRESAQHVFAQSGVGPGGAPYCWG